MTTEPITPERVRELLDAATPGELHMDQRWGDAADFRAPHNVAPLLWAAPDIAKAFLDQADEVDRLLADAKREGAAEALRDAARAEYEPDGYGSTLAMERLLDRADAIERGEL